MGINNPADFQTFSLLLYILYLAILMLLYIHIHVHNIHEPYLVMDD